MKAMREMARSLSARVLSLHFRCISPSSHCHYTHKKTTVLFSIPRASNHTHASSTKVNLVRIMSPFILCLHPDTCRHFSAEHAASNENTLKQLNSFIAIASLGCNSDIQTLQKRLQTDSFLRNQNIMRFPLAFYVSESNGNETSSASQCIRYTINIPSSLLRHTLAADSVQSIHSLADNWRRITKRILSDLSIVTKIPFAELSQLQFECEESPDFAQLGSISRYNRRQFRQVVDTASLQSSICHVGSINASKKISIKC